MNIGAKQLLSLVLPGVHAGQGLALSNANPYYMDGLDSREETAQVTGMIFAKGTAGLDPSLFSGLEDLSKALERRDAFQGQLSACTGERDAAKEALAKAQETIVQLRQATSDASSSVKQAQEDAAAAERAEREAEEKEAEEQRRREAAVSSASAQDAAVEKLVKYIPAGRENYQKKAPVSMSFSAVSVKARWTEYRDWLLKSNALKIPEGTDKANASALDPNLVQVDWSVLKLSDRASLWRFSQRLEAAAKERDAKLPPGVDNHAMKKHSPVSMGSGPWVERHSDVPMSLSLVRMLVVFLNGSQDLKLFAEYLRAAPSIEKKDAPILTDAGAKKDAQWRKDMQTLADKWTGGGPSDDEIKQALEQYIRATLFAAKATITDTTPEADVTDLATTWTGSLEGKGKWFAAPLASWPTGWKKPGARSPFWADPEDPRKIRSFGTTGIVLGDWLGSPALLYFLDKSPNVGGEARDNRDVYFQAKQGLPKDEDADSQSDLEWP